jgi:hypothetical protein
MVIAPVRPIIEAANKRSMPPSSMAANWWTVSMRSGPMETRLAIITNQNAGERMTWAIVQPAAGPVDGF